jgi:hypothetical protein
VCLLFLHKCCTQADLDFSSRFLCAFWFTAVGLYTNMKVTLLCDKCKKNEVQSIVIVVTAVYHADMI